MEGFWQDCRFAARTLFKRPVFTAVAVITLALGIGANTAIFSVVNAVLLQPLPYKDSDRLVRIVQNRAGGGGSGLPQRMAGVSTEDLQELRPRTETLSHIAAYSRNVSTLTGREEPIRLTGANVSPALFPMLGARPMMGRTFEEIEERPGNESVVILSHAAWERYFGSDPSILGRGIILEGRAHAVIGVMPPDFYFPDREALFWTPFVLSPVVRTPGERMIQIAQTLARVKDGVALEQSQAELNTIFRQLRDADAAFDAQAPPPGPGGPPQAGEPMIAKVPPDGSRQAMKGPGGPNIPKTTRLPPSGEGQPVMRGGPDGPAPAGARGAGPEGPTRAPRGPLVAVNASIELVRLKDEMVAPVRPALLVLLVAVAFVLLIACANVANLLLARAASRQQEIAVRGALGAGRVRLMRQVLTESLLLALVGGTIGTTLAFWGVRLLATLGPGNIPRLEQIRIDLPVLIFTIAISVLTGILFGIAPALRLSRSDTMQALKEGATAAAPGFDLFRRGRTRSLLGVSEIALAMVLLVGAALLIGSFLRLSNVDPGYEPSDVLTFQVALPQARYPEAQQATFYDHLLSSLQAMPGTQAAAMSNTLPLQPGIMRLTLDIQGRPQPTRPEEAAFADIRIVSHDYTDAMGIRLVDGRSFNENDRAGQPLVLMVNRSLARKYFGDRNPVGQVVRTSGPDPWQIVGVIEDVRHTGLDSEPQPEIYMDYRQAQAAMPRGPAGMFFAVRSNADSRTLATNVRGVVQQLDSQVTIDNVATMEQRLSSSVAEPRFYAVLLGIFAGVAVTLAGIGIYGILAYSVSQRTREIAIRMALGAERREVLGLVLRQGMALAALGIALGLAGAFAVTRYLQNMLFGLSPSDPATFIGVSVMLALLALAACYVPARRATKVNPIVALRYE